VESRYLEYRMSTRSRWAPAALELADSGEEIERLAGFANLESALVVLTHPMLGYFFRRDGQLGTYRVWHDRLRVTRGACVRAEFPLLESLRLVPTEKQGQPHSVLIERETEFTIYLPPQRVPT
jgi:hypothetical protein